MNPGETITIVGITILFLTSLLHIVKGYPRITNAIRSEKIILPSFLSGDKSCVSSEELRVVWLSFGIHLMIISLVLFLMLKDNSNLILILATLPIIDAILLKVLIKTLHLGAPLLALSGLLVFVGKWII